MQQKPAQTDTSKIIQKLKASTSRFERMQIALKFFETPGSYVEVPTGWGESYMPVRDDGGRIAALALEDIPNKNDEIKGLTFEEEVKLLEITIHGRGGDSEHEEHFRTGSEAQIATFLDGGKERERIIHAWKMSDGSYFRHPAMIRVRTITEEEKKKVLDSLSPAQKTVLGIE